MREKNKTAIKYGVLSLLVSFCTMLVAFVIQLTGMSAWFGAMSIVTGVGGIMMILISLADHFDN